MYVIANAPSAAPITLSSGAATAAFNVIAGEPGAGTQCNLNMPGSNRLNGQPFLVRAAGNVTMPAGTYTTAATPISFALYASNTASFAAATANGIFSTTAVGIFTVTSATPVAIEWEIEAQMHGSNASGRIAGRGTADTWAPSATVIEAITAVGVLASFPSSVVFSAEPPLQFAVGIVTVASNLLGTGGSAVANLTNFELEA
jgi:hypothetical protein